MKPEKDIEKFDYLSVSLKSDYADKLTECYHALGWKAAYAEDDKDYADMKYVLFSRPHVFPNKDRLQYVQVRMEHILNRASEKYIRKHSRSTAFAVTLGVFALVFAAAGLCLFFLLNSLLANIGAYVCFGLGGISLLGLIYPLTKVRKRENKRLKKELAEGFALFEKLVKEAAELSLANVDLNAIGAESLVYAEGV